jgi:hypothetical protein
MTKKRAVTVKSGSDLFTIIPRGKNTKPFDTRDGIVLVNSDVVSKKDVKNLAKNWKKT